MPILRRFYLVVYQVFAVGDAVTESMATAWLSAALGQGGAITVIVLLLALQVSANIAASAVPANPAPICQIDSRRVNPQG